MSGPLPESAPPSSAALTAARSVENAFAFAAVGGMVESVSVEDERGGAGEMIDSAPPSFYVQPPLWYYPQTMVVAPAPILTYQSPPTVVYAPGPVVYEVPVYRPPVVYVRRPRYYYYYGW